jgi:hypothetical protein
MKYILDDNGNAVIEPDLMKWAKWFETAKRSLSDETFAESRVSTVFLGLDHAFGGGPPMLWETMVFGGPLDHSQERYTTREAALKGHSSMVERVKKENRQ